MGYLIAPAAKTSKVLAYALVGLLLAGASGSNNQRIHASPPPVADQQTQSPEQIGRDLRKTKEVAEGERLCQGGGRSLSSELCAQWRAADAAVSSASAAWILGILGLVIGSATLLAAIAAAKYAKRAADEAEKAARAAVDAVLATNRANEISEDTAKRQLRAYISVDGCEITRTDDGFVIAATLKNCGQTPAYGVRIMGESFAAEYPLRTPNRGFQMPAGGYDTPLGPGQTIDAVYALRADDPDEAMLQVVAGQIGLYIQGVCQYQDAFQEQHETRFRQVFGGRVANSAGLVMHAAEMGNSAN